MNRNTLKFYHYKYILLIPPSSCTNINTIFSTTDHDKTGYKSNLAIFSTTDPDFLIKTLFIDRAVELYIFYFLCSINQLKNVSALQIQSIWLEVGSKNPNSFVSKMKQLNACIHPMLECMPIYGKCYKSKHNNTCDACTIVPTTEGPFTRHFIEQSVA